MKTGTTLEVLANRIIAEAASKKDYAMDTRSLAMTDEGSLSFSVRGENKLVKPTELCVNQICGRTGIPRAYANRLFTEAPQLLAKNVNHWFAATPETRMLRTLNNGKNIARAFLSQKYRSLDNYDLMNAVLPRIIDAGCEVKSIELTDYRLYVQAVTPKISGEISKGDTVQAGIVISNSEVGCGSVKIEPMIYRLACTNGMILPTALRKHHIGRAGDGEWVEGDASEVFSDETRRLDDKAFWAKVNDVTLSALDQVKFAASVKRLQAATKVQTGDPLVATEVIAKKYGLAESEKHNVLLHLAKGGDLSLWGLANAVTRTAEDCDKYDRAIELERFGGEVIELPANTFANN